MIAEAALNNEPTVPAREAFVKQENADEDSQTSLRAQFERRVRVYWLRRNEGAGTTEIARVLGVSRTTVWGDLRWIHLRRAMARRAKQTEDQWIPYTASALGFYDSPRVLALAERIASFEAWSALGMEDFPKGIPSLGTIVDYARRMRDAGQSRAAIAAAFNLARIQPLGRSDWTSDCVRYLHRVGIQKHIDQRRREDDVELAIPEVLGLGWEGAARALNARGVTTPRKKRPWNGASLRNFCMFRGLSLPKPT